MIALNGEHDPCALIQNGNGTYPINRMVDVSRETRRVIQ
jgi:hypothetical protein